MGYAEAQTWQTTTNVIVQDQALFDNPFPSCVIELRNMILLIGLLNYGSQLLE